jgi:hypothetical protein
VRGLGNLFAAVLAKPHRNNTPKPIRCCSDRLSLSPVYSPDAEIVEPGRLGTQSK